MAEFKVRDMMERISDVSPDTPVKVGVFYGDEDRISVDTLTGETFGVQEVEDGEKVYIYTEHDESEASPDGTQVKDLNTMLGECNPNADIEVAVFVSNGEDADTISGKEVDFENVADFGVFLSTDAIAPSQEDTMAYQQSHAYGLL